LIVGVSVGLALLLFKEYLISEIVDALEEEVTAACDCTLAFDSFSLSFATLRGRATNVRLLEKGTTKLSFESISARFNLSQITRKVVELDALVLSNGVANGVGPDSATFRFIDQLTTPPSPEKARPNRWRVVLNHLEVRNSRLREQLGERSELVGTGVALDVRRTGETFLLTPTITDLRYRTLTDPTLQEFDELPLGSARGSVAIEDLQTVFRELVLGRDDSQFSLSGTVDTEHADRLTGSATYSLRSEYLGLPDWLSGAFSGSGALSGSLGSPIVCGPLDPVPPAPFTLFVPGSTALSFTSLQGNLCVDVNHGKPIVSISELSATTPAATLRGSRPLRYSQAGLTAQFELALPQLAIGPFSAQGARGSVTISPRGADTIATITLDTTDLRLEEQSLGPAQLGVTVTPGAVTVVAHSTDPRVGSLQWAGTIDTTHSPPLLTSGNLTLKQYQLPLAVPLEDGRRVPVAITTSLSLSGPLELAQLRGEGATSISFPELHDGMELRGKSTLRDGTLEVTLPDSNYKGTLNLRLDLLKSQSGKLRIALPGLPLSRFIPHDRCGTLNTTLDYSFPISKPLLGSGALILHELSTGCAPYALQVRAPREIPITNGALQLAHVGVHGGASALALSGEIGIARGFNLQLGGDVLLSALLPFLPSLEDLQGTLTANATVTGPLSTPKLGGRIQMNAGELGMVSPAVEVHKAQGLFLLSNDRIEIERFSGTLNNGNFSISGQLLPFDIPASKITTHISGVTIEPLEDAVITCSGDLTLDSRDRARQTLSGSITVDFAEISKNFDLNKIILQTLSGYFIPSRVQPRANTRPINLDLDVAIDAPRNVFVLTPFFSAELNAHLRALGTIAEPTVTGQMQVLSGWVGLKDTRFDVTSGTLAFRPGSLAPQLELASEGHLRTSTGESILVMLEAVGPLTSPRIVLSSDRGLSHEELLALLTSSRSLTGQTIANRAGAQFERDQRFFLSQDSFTSIWSFLQSLARIETLSLEPIFNPFSGLIEPAVVARKNLTPRLYLLGNSTFGTLQNSRAAAVYNVTPDMSLSAFVQSMPSRRQSALGSDLTYTILSEQPELLTIHVTGATSIAQRDLLAAARLGGASRVKNRAESLASIQRDVLQFMNQQGFLGAQTAVTCETGVEYCNTLQIALTEGPRATISSVIFQETNLPIPAAKIIDQVAKTGAVATTAVLQEVERRLVIALRNEGYIAARVSPSYRSRDRAGEVDLIIAIEPRQPISFIFKGNTIFSAAEFLESIQLFERKRPFGNNTIKLLVENITRMYHDRGFRFVEVSYTEDRSAPERIVYTVTIAEGVTLPVHEVTLRGNDRLPLSRIKQVMRELGYSEEISLLKPRYAVPDQLDALRDILLTTYRSEGYPDAQVNHSVERSKDTDSLSITFQIAEGTPQIFSRLTVSGFPPQLSELPAPPTPLSVPRINRHVQLLLDTLTNEGYLYPQVSTEVSSTDNTLTLQITTADRITVSAISFEGLVRIKEAVARTYTDLTIAAPYRSDDVNRTKQRLLRSGLFSRVEVVPADGALDAPHEALVVRLTERTLNTLEVGGGANSELGLHLFGEAVDKSVFADGRSLALRLDSYLDRTGVSNSADNPFTQAFASLRYTDPAIAGSDFTLSEDLRFQRQELPTQEWDLNRISLASYLFRPLGSGLSVSAGHTFLLDNLQNVSPDAILSELDFNTVRLSFLSTIIALDRRDDPLLPRSGYQLALEPKLALREIGSQGAYGIINTSASGVVPLEALSSRLSIGVRGLAGIASPFDSTPDIPITQRFYLGGRTTVRGFRQNSLGPRGADGAIIGGDTLIAGNTQLQYLATDSVSTHLFFDYGNVFLQDRGVHLADIRTSLGIGFQFLSPIGPIGFDLGFPLDRMVGEPTSQLHFSVGSSF
jgi:outer membrane protein insertion porin family